MKTIQVFVETGKSKTFAGAVAWPGWCRSGRDEPSALQALLNYAPRYAKILIGAGIEFQAPVSPADFSAAEHLPGSATTDFGAPAAVLAGDRDALAKAEFDHLQSALWAGWDVFDRVIRQAEDKELRKGPRGGGRDLQEIVRHVSEAEGAYLGKLAWKVQPGGGLADTRAAVQQAIEAVFVNGLPAQIGPRGGSLWPLRYFIRRSAWHVLDHAWEIEDRLP